MPGKEKILLLLYGFFSCCDCYSFDSKEAYLISGIKDCYFGYSLLLQKGPIPRIIVGAPKDKIDDDMTHNGGQVYDCSIQGMSICTPLFKKNSFNSLYNPNGDFLGATLEGDDDTNGALVVCSPRSSVIVEGPPTGNQIQSYTYTPGSCYYKKENIKITEPFITANALQIDNSYYIRPKGWTTESYFDYGYALFGFDISFYNKDHVVFGAPGLKNANGATISFSLTKARFEDVHRRVPVRVLPEKKHPVLLEEYSYFGYSVDSEIFQQHNDTFCVVAGEPRGNNLKGKAVLFYYDKQHNSMNTLRVFEGDIFGSYFGASVLAVDVSNDNMVDILIGAPMSVGSTYEEGCVYFYRASKQTFLPENKLTGSSTVRSRFGTSMVSLGDFDLDGYNDVAISAPFENNGEGAVYIYRGSFDGLSNECSQKLLPSDFEINVKANGFGLGISKGNDIDNNGHNDIAIGAYKTDQVFIVKSKNIIDYQASFESNTIKDGLQTHTTNFDLELCLSFKKRSKVSVLREVEFNILMSLDYRSVEHFVNISLQAKLDNKNCKAYNVKIKTNFKDVSPFLIDINIELSSKMEHVIAHGNNNSKLSVPYQLGCANTNCITGLTINVKSSRETIILGKHKQFDLETLVQNDGDPAHLCELIIEVPAGMQLQNSENCIRSNQHYDCRVTDKLYKNSGKNQIYVFDVDSKILKTGDHKIQVRVTSIGINKNGYKNKVDFMISVISRRTTYIKGSNGKNYLASSPEAIELKENKNEEVLFEFSMGKTGPSPVEIHVDILLPHITHMGEDIFDILSVQSTIDAVSLDNCHPTVQNVNLDEILPKIDDKKIPPERTVMLHCKHFACLQYSCYGGYLNTLADTASFEIRILVKSYHLVSRFKTELRNKNIIAYIPIVLQRNPTNTIDKTSEALPLLIFVENEKLIPLWAYLAAGIIGLGLFALVVFILYKRNFFNRTYKERLKQEKMLLITRRRETEVYFPENEEYGGFEEMPEEYYVIYNPMT